MATPVRHLRIPDDEWEAWRTVAVAEGLSVTSWVRGRCEIGAGGEQDGTDRGVTPGVPAQTPPAPPEGIDCLHPKGALVDLAAGLKRCGACGLNRRADGTWPP